MEAKNYKLDHKIKAKVSGNYLFNHIHDYDVDPESSHIYLFDYSSAIDHEIANKFIRNMNLCMRINPNKSILIHMKSSGGDWEEAMAIYDCIRACPVAVTILNYSCACSAASVIFQSANKRVMMPNSYFMFHNGTMRVSGTPKQVDSAIRFMKKDSDLMLNIYAKRMQEPGRKFSKRSLTYIKKWIKEQMDKKEDVYLTAKETIELGLADEIFDYNWASLTEYTPEQLNR